MKIVVVGDGKVGATLVSQLVKEGHDVTVIDNNAAVLRRSTDTMDVFSASCHTNTAPFNLTAFLTAYPDTMRFRWFLLRFWGFMLCFHSVFPSSGQKMGNFVDAFLKTC